jgi:DNA-binding NarL/FixJ family response regulator
MRTLIIDDHLLFSAGLQLLLGDTPGVGAVDCVASGAEALQRAAAVPYELVLLDWHLGREPSGAALIAQLREALPQAHVVIVSGDVHPDLVRQAIEAGAVGFVPKESSPEAMIQALQAVAHGGICLPSAALAVDAARWMGPASSPTPPAARRGAGAELPDIGAAFPQLTPRHVEVLGRIVRGLSNKEIARELGIADGTVKQHANAIFRELGLQNRTEAVYLLARMGVRFH